MKILLVDDDEHIQEMISFALNKAGFAISWAKSVKEALDLFTKEKFELVILDINLPDGDGFEICKKIRTTNQVPIVFLTCNDEEIDKVVAFEIGGDDYVTKPFSPRELIARIKAIQKRVQAGQTPSDEGTKEVLNYLGLELDLIQYNVRFKEDQINLTATEFEILKSLMNTPQKVFNRSEIIDRIYKGQYSVSDRTIDTHIRRIRKKFEGVNIDPIETAPGFGYRMGKWSQ